MSPRESSWVGVRSGSGRKMLSSRSRFVSEGRKKKAKNSGMRITRISVARDVRESWKKRKCVCVYSWNTAFAQHLLSLEMRISAEYRYSLLYSFEFPQTSWVFATTLS